MTKHELAELANLESFDFALPLEVNQALIACDYTNPWFYVWDYSGENRVFGAPRHLLEAALPAIEVKLTELKYTRRLCDKLSNWLYENATALAEAEIDTDVLEHALGVLEELGVRETKTS